MTEIAVKTSHGSMAIAETGGEGLPLVMLHANSLCKESFRPQIEALKHKRRVIAIDLPGHGNSSKAIDPRRTYSIPGYADAVMEKDWLPSEVAYHRVDTPRTSIGPVAAQLPIRAAEISLTQQACQKPTAKSS